MRALRVLLPVVGVLALAAAAVLRFVVVPSQSQWPADVDSTRSYSGTLEQISTARHSPRVTSRTCS